MREEQVNSETPILDDLLLRVNIKVSGISVDTRNKLSVSLEVDQAYDSLVRLFENQSGDENNPMAFEHQVSDENYLIAIESQAPERYFWLPGESPALNENPPLTLENQTKDGSSPMAFENPSPDGDFWLAFESRAAEKKIRLDVEEILCHLKAELEDTVFLDENEVEVAMQGLFNRFLFSFLSNQREARRIINRIDGE